MTPPRVAHLESVYEAIAGRMKALPISHPELHVEAVGFLGCDEGHLGVLITPWCMQLVFAPPEGTLAVGERTFGLPAGPVTLTWQSLDGFGALASRSLFSPMSQFADQRVAVEVATKLLRTLLTPPPRTEPSRRALFPFLRRERA
ncbi:MAG TPA: [NiFe]-hydrogenase assembly chaperone HybE [Archangium sp.]